MRVTVPDMPQVTRKRTPTTAPPPSTSARDRRDASSRERLLQRVRGEFRDMPGLVLTLPQAGRLFGLREDICARALATVMQEGLLYCRNSCYRKPSGVF
jgi:hypothetical protein